jgi:hypothetical protein
LELSKAQPGGHFGVRRLAFAFQYSSQVLDSDAREIVLLGIAVSNSGGKPPHSKGGFVSHAALEERFL